jgi:hypothetical protein
MAAVGRLVKNREETRKNEKNTKQYINTENAKYTTKY